MSNENLDDRWLWFIDDAPLQALLRAESAMPTMKMRAASSPALVKSVSLHMEGRATEAIEVLENAVRSGDKHPDVYVMLGQFLFEGRRWEEAAKAYKGLAELDAKHPTAAFNQGVCALRLSKWAEAEAAFRQALALSAARSEANLGLGIAALQQQKGSAALEAFDRFLAKDASSEPGRFGRAVALQLMKRFDEALAEYEKLRRIESIQAEVATNCLALAIAQRNTSSIKRAAKRLLERNGNSPTALEALGTAALLDEDYRAAATHLEAALAAGADHADIWAGLGVAAARSGDTSRASAALRRALELQPGHPGALLEQAALQDKIGSAADARREWEKAAAATRSEVAYWNLALAAQRQGDSKATIEALQRLVATNRQRNDAWFLLGETLSEDARPAEAAKAFAEALRIKPDWLDAQFNFGLLAWRAGHLDRAWQAFESAASRQPDRLELHEAMAQLAIERGDAARASEALKKLERKGAAPEALLFNVAVVLQRAGRAKDAEALYRRAVGANPNFVEGLVNLGHTLQAQGDRSAAEECWDRAVELRPELAL